MDFFGKKEEYLILETIINEMTLRVPVAKLQDVGVRPPVNPDELEDLVGDIEVDLNEKLEED